MSLAASPRFLPAVFAADTAGSLAVGLAQLGAGSALATLTGLDPRLLLATGAFLLPYAAMTGWAASRRPAPRGLVAFLAAGNLGWAVAAFALLATAGPGLTGWGQALLALHGVFTLAMADLQWFGLRGRRAAGAGHAPA